MITTLNFWIGFITGAFVIGGSVVLLAICMAAKSADGARERELSDLIDEEHR